MSQYSPTDHRNYKTPFYEIEVQDAAGQRRVKLPHQLLRLVESIEIFETFQQSEFSTIKVVFVEGSREPLQTSSSAGSSGLYNIPNPSSTVLGSGSDSDISGAIGNKPGMVTDLKFSGSSSTTFLSEAEQAFGSIISSPLVSIAEEETNTNYSNSTSSPLFLLQERNIIIVTWGYKENPKSVRKVAGRIQLITINFPEGDQVRTEVTAQDSGSVADQICPVNPVVFADSSQTSTGAVQLNDMAVSDILSQLADNAGIKIILSDNLLNDKYDTSHVKIWSNGESLHAFLHRLAKMTNCYYKLVVPTDGSSETLIVVKKTDFNSRTLNIDPGLLTYKGSNSILKNVEIRADFGVVGGNAQGSVTNSGELNSYSNSHGSEQLTLFNAGADNTKQQQAVDYHPANSSNSIPFLKSIHDNVLGGQSTGKYQNQPIESDKTKQDLSKINAMNQLNHCILLNFTTIGLPQLTTGIVQISNLGKRHSGKYEIITATHSLNSSGYTTTCSCQGYSVSSGGVTIPDASKGINLDQNEAFQLFEPSTSVDTGSSVRDEVDKTLGIK